MCHNTAGNKMLKKFEIELENAIQVKGSKVKEAMNYSLLAGGKRIRPMMLLTLLEDLGGNPKTGMKTAIGLEMIHTYSLVHDDLPAMDNDDFRRHKPTNHKVYGEGTAILAGDALLNDAFLQVIHDDLEASLKVDLIEILGRNAGPEGMILGQEIDIANDFKTLEELSYSYQLKTGCLFASALESAVLLANRKDLQETAKHIAYQLGIFFQYQDDILEYTSDFESMGKNIQSDFDQDKKTIVTFLGLEQAQSVTRTLYEEILQSIQNLTDQKGLLELVMAMEQRVN